MKKTSHSSGLVIGFSAVLILLVVVMILGVNRMDTLQGHLKHFSSEQEAEKGYIHAMYNAARERTIALLNYTIMTDPFERDDQLTHFHRQAEHFIKARNSLLAIPLTERQLELIRLQGEYTSMALTIQNQVVELLHAGRINDARYRLVHEAIPAQEKVLTVLQLFLEYEDQEAAKILRVAQDEYSRARISLIVVGFSAIVIGLLIAVATVRQSRAVARTLFEEKERAQTTLFSIGDAVITTDAEGVINMVNPVAENILGVPSAEVLNRPLHEVFHFYTNNQPFQVPLAQAMAEDHIVFSSQAIQLRRADGTEFAFEYTAAPIRNAAGHISGGVLTLRDVTEMTQLSAQLQYQASHDALTGLINRREFEGRVEQAISSARHEDLNHVLCYLDLDQFKVVNDTCGHSAGDELLKQLAPLLRPLIRGSDVLARLGGDEFGVLLEGCTLDKGLQIADRLRQTIKDFRFIWRSNAFEIGVSIGVVAINASAASLNELLSAADSACYVAKDLGRNQVHVYRPDDEAVVARHGEMQWVQVLNNAMAADRFTLFYQPIVPVSNNGEMPHLYEFLVRLKNTDGTLVPPMAFIPAAERYNLASALDRWVVENALNFLSNHAGHDIMQNGLFTINLSAQSLSDKQFQHFVMGCFDRVETNPENICFEVTETAAIANLSTAIDFIATLRQMGCRFALDDFGSGLSSYGYLKNLNVDYIKIDGSFIRNIADDTLNQAFVSSINQIAKIMGITTIAEYVETEQCADFLKSCGVDYLQGHWLGKPRPIEGLLFDQAPPSSRAPLKIH